jgi:hypothetical protein
MSPSHLSTGSQFGEIQIVVVVVLVVVLVVVEVVVLVLVVAGTSVVLVVAASVTVGCASASVLLEHADSAATESTAAVASATDRTVVRRGSCEGVIGRLCENVGASFCDEG